MFVELFKAHPLCKEVSLCEIRPDKLKTVAEENKVSRTYTDFDEVLKQPDIDGVAIFTGRWSHAPLAIKALKAGKHVYSAVPAACTVEEMEELVKTVEETGLIYSLGETSFYRPQRIWCRKKHMEGAFGNVVYGEGQYYHDMRAWFYTPFLEANGPGWEKYASVPPMLYPTHSICHVLGVTMSRFTHATCYGWEDKQPEDGIFLKDVSAFGNVWSNQSAFFKVADGGMARINEFRRTGASESRQNIMGDIGAYEEHGNPDHEDISVAEQITGKQKSDPAIPQMRAIFSQNIFVNPPLRADGSFDHEEAQRQQKKVKEDVSWVLGLPGVEITEENRGNLSRDFIGKKHLGVNPVHDVQRLPAEFVGMPNGHCGSHQFMVHDFFESITTGKLPPSHVWIAARYNTPGIVAHESCKRDGERLAIPDFGLPPKGSVCLDPTVIMNDE